MKKPIERKKTKKQLINEALRVAVAAVICVGIGVAVIVLWSKGIIPDKNPRIGILLFSSIALIALGIILFPAFYFTNLQYFDKKQKFKRKCEELLLFEKEVLKEAKERFLPLKSITEPLELDLHVSLIWYDRVALCNGEQPFFKNRMEFFNGYSCLLQCAVTRKGEDPMNDELICFNRVFEITWIGGWITRFHRNNVPEEYYKDFENNCKQIQQIGYENFLKTLSTNEKIYNEEIYK